MRPRFVAEVATSPCGNHLAREGRLARASALLLMRERICHSFSAESSADPGYSKPEPSRDGAERTSRLLMGAAGRPVGVLGQESTFRGIRRALPLADGYRGNLAHLIQPV